MSLSRRSAAKLCFSLGMTAVASVSGCAPATAGDPVDLVWGERGIRKGEFLKPRAMTVDQQDRLYIVDTTGRIQVFDEDGNYLYHWNTPDSSNGRPTGLGFVPGDQSPDGKDRLLVADTHYYQMLTYYTDGSPTDAAPLRLIAQTAEHRHCQVVCGSQFG